MLCILETNNFKSAIKLYSEGFNTTEYAAKGIIEDFTETVYAFVEGDEVCGILCASPINFNEQNGVLIHGGVTDTKHRKKGIFTSLLHFALQNAKADFHIITNRQGYEDFYEKLGFQNAFAMRLLNRSIKRNLWARADFDTITAKKLCDYHAKYLKKTGVKISVKQAGALLSQLYSKGISTAETSKAYALYYRLQDKLAITELYAETDVDAWFLLEAIADRDGRSTAQLLLSAENTVFAGEGQRVYVGMARGLKDADINYLGEMPF